MPFLLPFCFVLEAAEGFAEVDSTDEADGGDADEADDGDDDGEDDDDDEDDDDEDNDDDDLGVMTEARSLRANSLP